MATRLLTTSMLVFLLALRGLAQSSQPATQPSVPMDLPSVVLDWEEKAWKPKVEGAAPPLIVVGGRTPKQNQCLYLYSHAASGHSEAGRRHLLGYLGGPFPVGSTLVPETFERQGEQIRLILRYDAKSTTPANRDGNFCFLGATFGNSLADGSYQVTVEVKGLPAGVGVPATQQLKFEQPDPRFKRGQQAFVEAKTLSPQELFSRYRTLADGMTGIAAPHEGRFLGTTPLAYATDDAQVLSMLKWEIVSRGHAIAPLLIDALKERAVRNPEPLPQEDPPPGIALELMDMLTRIGDARAAPVLIDILSGKLRCNSFVVRAAEEHIEKLTLIRFRKFDPHHSSYSEAARGPYARVEPYEIKERIEFCRHLAVQYTSWITWYPADGPDSTPWVKEAVRRARVWLEGDDLSEAYNAAAFLRSGSYHPRVVDDDPARTTRRIAEILEKCEVASVDNSPKGYAYYTYRHKPTGQTLPVTIHNWVDLLTRTSSVDAQSASLLIRLDREMPDYPGVMARYLLKGGGTEAMAYRVEQYRKLLAEMNQRGIDPKTEISTLRDKSLQPLIWNGQYFRWGIERWAGRTFATDDDLVAWWAEEGGKTQQQWLEAGLPITAAKADAGDRQSQYLLRVMLDNALPNPPSRFVWMEPGSGSDPLPRAEEGEPFRVKWLADHLSQLRCDAGRGTFVIQPVGR